MASNDSDPSTEPKWKLVERIVAMLEKSITPEAEVLHNIELPDITTGHKRQCDVVIRYGKPPRQTLTIVEVQDRSRKVEISHVQGWWEKMLAVGAQHLIVVSALDYPQSVKDEVTMKRGPAIKLLCLRQVEESDWPLDIINGAVNIAHPKITIKGQPTIDVEDPSVFGTKLKGLRDIDPIFRRDSGVKPLSLLDLLNECIDQIPSLSMLAPGTHSVTCTLQPGSERLRISIDGKEQAIRRLDLPVEVVVQEHRLPITFSAYEQVNYKGSLAWALVAEGQIDERKVHLRTILLPQADGTFSIVSVELTGFGEQKEGWIAFTPISEKPTVE